MPVFTGDERFFDGKVTGVLIRKTAAGADDTADSVANCLRRDVFNKDEGGNLRASMNDCWWDLPDANITNDPRPMDVVKQSGGTRWVIQTARLQDLINSWECFCTKEAS